MTNVVSFQDALRVSADPAKRYLLLGNGFSTALFPEIFSYRSLRDEADFSTKPELASVFDQLGTSDFEKVIRAMEYSAIVAISYSADANLVTRIKEDAEQLKSILVSTIASNHPNKTDEVTDAQKKSCSTFLNRFKIAYTLNYDVLLYWVLLSGRDTRPEDIDDGFRMPDSEYGADYRVFDSPHSPTFFFLHGGLHLYDSGSQTRKYVWADSGRPLMAQVREAVRQDLYPLFVAEGTSEQKMTKINHNGYLSKALRSFEKICDTKGADLFIFGHSLNDTDEHILKYLRKGKIGRVFISAFKGSNPEYDTNFISKTRALNVRRSSRYPLEIILFDAETANVWSHT